MVTTPFIRNLLKNNGLLAFLMGLAILFLSPSLKTGYLGDDAFYSTLRGYLEYEGLSIPREIFNRISGYATASGRFTPIANLLMISLFSLFTDLFWYKCFVLFMVLLNLLRFHRLLTDIAGQAFASAALLFAIPLLQFRFYHDPILMFYCHLLFFLLLVLESFISLRKYLQCSSKKLYFYLSVFFFILSLLTYEVSYSLFPFYFIFILSKEKDWVKVLKLSLPFILLTLLALLLVIYLKVNSGMPTELSYRPNLSISAYLSALAIQLTSPLPLSYLLIGPNSVFSILGWPLSDSRIAAQAALVLLLAFTAGFCVCRNLKVSGIQPYVRFPAIFGLLLWFIPALLTSAVPKYQKELVYGLGYVPVLLQYFGVATLAACAFAVIFGRTSSGNATFIMSSLVFSLFVASIACTTFLANNATVIKMSTWLYPRLNFESALKAGLLEEVPQRSLLLFDNKYVWHDKYFYFMHSGKRLKMAPGTFETIGRDVWNVSITTDSLPSPSNYHIKERRWFSHLKDQQASALLLSRINVKEEMTEPVVLTTNQIRLFLRIPSHGAKVSDLIFAVIGQRYDSSKDYLLIPHTSMRRIRTGEDWIIFSMESKHELNIDTLDLILNPKPMEVQWLDGFYSEETNAGLRWRWGNKTSMLMITNTTPQPERLKISMSLATGWPTHSNLHIESSILTTTVQIHSAPTTFSTVFTIPPYMSVPIKFTSEAQRVLAEDPREMYFRIQDYQFEGTPTRDENQKESNIGFD